MSSSITIAEASGFTHPVVAAEHRLDERPTDMFSQVVRFRAIDGPSARVPTAAASDLASHATVVSSIDQAVAATLPAFGSVTGVISHYAAILEVDALVATHYASVHNLLRSLVRVKVAAVIDRFRKMLVMGDANVSGEFSGLLRLSAGAGRQLDATLNPEPGELVAGNIEHLVSMLDRQGGNGSIALVMNNAAFRKLYAGPYASQIEWSEHPELGTVQLVTGIPVLIDDFIPNTIDAANKTAVFAVALAGPSRVEAIFPSAHAGAEVRVRGPHFVDGTDRFTLTVNFDAGLLSHGKAAVSAIKNVSV